MAAKRGAGKQLTDHNWDEEDDPEEVSNIALYPNKLARYDWDIKLWDVAVHIPTIQGSTICHELFVVSDGKAPTMV